MFEFISYMKLSSFLTKYYMFEVTKYIEIIKLSKLTMICFEIFKLNLLVSEYSWNTNGLKKMIQCVYIVYILYIIIRISHIYMYLN